VFLSASDQVLGDTPPRKPFNTLVASGKFKPQNVVAEFCDVVSGKSRGRDNKDDIILYESPGMGILDAGIGRWVYDRARQKGLGTELPFGEEEH
jgi:ornithine cyclodeaminase